VTENNFIAYSNLGGYEFDQGHYDEAIDLCREAIKLMPATSRHMLCLVPPCANLGDWRKGFLSFNWP